jgi:hypothetical protein
MSNGGERGPAEREIGADGDRHRRRRARANTAQQGILRHAERRLIAGQNLRAGRRQRLLVLKNWQNIRIGHRIRRRQLSDCRHQMALK